MPAVADGYLPGYGVALHRFLIDFAGVTRCKARITIDDRVADDSG
jgi:hypothetical protein